jgi:hypothetical protein
MSRVARYALYLAPTPESPLGRFGSTVLGRDAASGAAIEGYAPPGYSSAEWRTITADARRYGFHATLKAPFRLGEDRSVDALEEAIADLARAHAPFSLGPLRVSTLAFGAGRGFVALTPSARSAPLAALEADALQKLDLFRAEMTEADRARRKPERLTDRKRELLERWGYPYVLDQFRLHFTLSNAVVDPTSLANALGADFARLVPDPDFRVDALALFVEAAPSAAFQVARRFALGPADGSVAPFALRPGSPGALGS